MKETKRILMAGLALFCLTPYVNSAGALLSGMVFALVIGNPDTKFTRTLTHYSLMCAVIGLGAGMDLYVIRKVGLEGLGYTFVGIVFAFLAGNLLGRLFRVPANTSLLISTGTAICGGSAIAAVASAIKPRPEEITIALGIVFVLNAVALFVFPPLGHALGLSESQFGLWSALAIHDTSSVVGATLQYGSTALAVGTSVKLARALWIFPLTLAIAMLRSKDTQAHVRRPWFILGFFLVAALVTYFPDLREAGAVVDKVSRRLLVMTLFFIGCGLTRDTLRQVGLRPFLQGVSLWAFVTLVSLLGILFGWIH